MIHLTDHFIFCARGFFAWHAAASVRRRRGRAAAPAASGRSWTLNPAAAAQSAVCGLRSAALRPAVLRPAACGHRKALRAASGPPRSTHCNPALLPREKAKQRNPKPIGTHGRSSPARSFTPHKSPLQGTYNPRVGSVATEPTYPLLRSAVLRPAAARPQTTESTRVSSAGFSVL